MTGLKISADLTLLPKNPPVIRTAKKQGILKYTTRVMFQSVDNLRMSHNLIANLDNKPFVVVDVVVVVEDEVVVVNAA